MALPSEKTSFAQRARLAPCRLQDANGSRQEAGEYARAGMGYGQVHTTHDCNAQVSDPSACDATEPAGLIPCMSRGVLCTHHCLGPAASALSRLLPVCMMPWYKISTPAGDSRHVITRTMFQQHYTGLQCACLGTHHMQRQTTCWAATLHDMRPAVHKTVPWNCCLCLTQAATNAHDAF